MDCGDKRCCKPGRTGRKSQGPSFTDEDLQQLRENLSMLDIREDSWNLKALLARLEAAEALCDYIGKVPDLKDMDWFFEGDRLFQAWRKAAGKGE